MAAGDFKNKAKRRLGILEDNDKFDSDLDDFIVEAVANLFPIVQNELATETYILAADSNMIDLDDSTLSGDIETVRRLEIYDSDAANYNPLDDFTQHARIVYLYEDYDEAKTVRLHGLGRYNTANVPAEYEQVILAWVMSDFYALLIGDKRKYNIYSQTSGARSTENLRSLSDYFLDRGNQLLADRATVRGL